MRSFRTLDRRAGYSLSAFSLLLAMLAPGLVPAFASAATLTERSITLSSAAKGATDVTYDVAFKASSTGAGDAFVLQFCDSPVIGTTCNAPDGFSASAVTTGTAATTVSQDTNRLLVTTDVTDDEDVVVNLEHITNPSDAGAFYARIVSYDTVAHANAGTATALGAGVKDQGSVAMSATDAIGVSAAVLESMTFCVASGSSAITDNCGDAASHLPNIVLGDPTTGLDSTTIASAKLQTQISTNAVGGAVVNLKSNTPGCGGLLRAGAPSACDIKPAVTASSLVAGSGLFGLKTGTGSGTNGTFQAASGYSSSDYHLDYDVDNNDSEGITSTYGSPLLDTDGGTANNMNMELTLGASMANNTPAGNYSADLSMIATGKY